MDSKADGKPTEEHEQAKGMELAPKAWCSVLCLCVPRQTLSL